MYLLDLVNLHVHVLASNCSMQLLRMLHVPVMSPQINEQSKHYSRHGRSLCSPQLEASGYKCMVALKQYKYNHLHCVLVYLLSIIIDFYLKKIIQSANTRKCNFMIDLEQTICWGNGENFRK